MKDEQMCKCELRADDEAETPMSPEEVQASLNRLVEEGFAVREFRRGRDGKLHRVYVHYAYAKQYTTASAIAEKKRAAHKLNCR